MQDHHSSERLCHCFLLITVARKGLQSLLNADHPGMTISAIHQYSKLVTKMHYPVLFIKMIYWFLSISAPLLIYKSLDFPVNTLFIENITFKTVYWLWWFRSAKRVQTMEGQSDEIRTLSGWGQELSGPLPTRGRASPSASPKNTERGRALLRWPVRGLAKCLNARLQLLLPQG